jgi:4-amino-4-deoxy-L-arabinose transferase-like glycosyltransferase
MWRNASDLQRYAFISAAFIFVFFCIPASKRSVYILPAYPFIAVLAAESFAVWGERSKRLMAAMSRTVMWFSIGIAGLVTLGLLLPFSPDVARFGSSLISSVSLWRVGVLVVLCVLMARVSRGCSARDEAQRLSLSLIGAVVILSVSAAEPAFFQLSQRAWLRSPQFSRTIDMSKYDRVYSFGSEAYATSFYLKKPFFAATPGLPSGSLVVVEEKNLERLKQQISPNVREVARFSSGLEPSKKSVLFVEIVEPLQG